MPVLHHIWQHRRRDYPGPGGVRRGGAGPPGGAAPSRCGSSWRTSAAVATGSTRCRSSAALPNVCVDLSGSGVDGGMLEACLEAVGVERLLWGCDLTIETGWAKLRYLEHLLSPAELELVRLAQRRRGSFPPARSPPTDAHRRQRLPGRLSLPARAGHLAGGRCSRRWTATGIDEAWVTPPARRLLARSRRGQRLARWRPTRSASAASARCRRCIPAGRAGRRCCERPRTAGAPAVRCDPTYYGIGPGGPVHARAGAVPAVAAGARADARGAARGRPPAPPQRPARRAARRRGARADPQRTRACAWSSPTPTGRSSRRCTSAPRRRRPAASGGTSAGSGARRRTTSRPCCRRSAPSASSSAPDSRSGSRRTAWPSSICSISTPRTGRRSSPAMPPWRAVGSKAGP